MTKCVSAADLQLILSEDFRETVPWKYFHAILRSLHIYLKRREAPCSKEVAGISFLSRIVIQHQNISFTNMLSAKLLFGYIQVIRRFIE